MFVGLALLFVVRLGGGDPSQVPSALIDKPAPKFALSPLEGLVTANGQPVPGLSDADLKGRVTVVNVWASWCGPCRQEHPLLVELAKDPAIRLVGINQRDDPGVKAMAAFGDRELPHWVGSSGSLTSRPAVGRPSLTAHGCHLLNNE